MKRSLKTTISFLILSAIILFFISPDSPTHYFYDRCDSANFFMCGKAWMCGMKPYVDFTDSKGPLLWLIYGIGYLLSPQSYTGVLILSVVAYTFTYYITYKASFILLQDHQSSLLSTLLMTLAYFCPLYHFETRAEDFCMPFVIAALYNVLVILYNNKLTSKRLWSASLGFGICLGATFLIKYSITIMLGIFIPFMWLSTYIAQQSIWRSLGGICLGGIITILPFFIYFCIENTFLDFINQYFFVTFQTIKEINNNDNQGIHTYALRLMQNATTLIFFVVSAASPLFVPLVRRYKAFPLISVVFFIIVCMPNAKWSYYFSICAPFMLFGCTTFAKMIITTYHQKLLLINIVTTIIIITFTILSNYHYYHYSVLSAHMLNLKTQKDNPTRKAYKYYSNVLLQWGRHPRIIYVDTQCMSEYGVEAEALPGCRDWSMQNGATKEMRTSTWKAIASKKADFVIAATKESFIRLESMGYVKVDKKSIESIHTLYKRK